MRFGQQTPKFSSKLVISAKKSWIKIMCQGAKNAVELKVQLLNKWTKPF